MHIAVVLSFVLGPGHTHMIQCLQIIPAALVNAHNIRNDAFRSLMFTTRQWNLPLFLSRADVMKSRSLHCQLKYWKKKSQGTRSGEHVPCLGV
jgi:hypothetical protein